MHQLFFIGTEYAEHRRTIAIDQLPEAAGLRVFMALDPAFVLHGLKKAGQMLRRGQPLIDGFAFETAVVGMHVLAERAFAFEHRQQLMFKVETFNDRATALPQIIQSIAQRYPPQKFGAIGRQWQQISTACTAFCAWPVLALSMVTCRVK